MPQGSKKYGRNKLVCEKYRVQDRRKKNKLRKLRQIIKGLRTDKGISAIEKVIIRVKAA